MLPIEDMTRLIFQSTHPVRGATSDGKWVDKGKVFQSTHPVRGATMPILTTGWTARFQSTHPVRGATRQQPGRHPSDGDFNPRTP